MAQVQVKANLTQVKDQQVPALTLDQIRAFMAQIPAEVKAQLAAEEKTAKANKFTDGKGVKFELKDGKLVITCDLSGDYGLSTSGKTHIVANGNSRIPGFDGLGVTVNVYRKIKK